MFHQDLVIYSEANAVQQMQKWARALCLYTTTDKRSWLVFKQNILFIYRKDSIHSPTKSDILHMKIMIVLNNKIQTIIFDEFDSILYPPTNKKHCVFT